jgi:hypothetical protein
MERAVRNAWTESRIASAPYPKYQTAAAQNRECGPQLRTDIAPKAGRRERNFWLRRRGAQKRRRNANSRPWRSGHYRACSSLQPGTAKRAGGVTRRSGSITRCGCAEASIVGAQEHARRQLRRTRRGQSRGQRQSPPHRVHSESWPLSRMRTPESGHGDGIT